MRVKYSNNGNILVKADDINGHFVIPNSVTMIGCKAFRNCTGLTSIEIPNSVIKIGDEAFKDCTGLTSIEIPNSVIKIGDDAFEDCIGLTSIKIPDSITEIGHGAFFGCIGLSSIRIPDSIKKIEDYVFCGCTGLTSIEIPDSVTKIGNSSFSDCTGLTLVRIPSSVIAIDDFAFVGCSGLISIEVPLSLKKYSTLAFDKKTDIKYVPIATQKSTEVFFKKTDILKEYHKLDNNWTKYQIGEIIKNETFVTQGDLLCKIHRYPYYSFEDILADNTIPDGMVEYYATYSGYWLSSRNLFDVLDDSDCIGEILSEDDLVDRIKDRFSKEVVQDSFTKEKHIVNLSHNIGPAEEVECSFDFGNEGLILRMSYNRKSSSIIPMTKGDAVWLLLNNGESLKKIITTKPIYDATRQTIALQLYSDDIRLMSQNHVTRIRMEQNNGVSRDLDLGDSSGMGYYQSLKFRACVCKAVELAKEHNVFHLYELEQSSNNFVVEPCYVYLMRDNTNGAHKIGISNKPQVREKTLQSEKPDIELLCSKKYPSRRLALAIEKALHETFADKHMRGEWFRLNEQDLYEVKQMLE